MAKIIPFKAWRYHPDLTAKISDLISPPYDVISEDEQKTLRRIPYNSIHLALPGSSEPATTAAATLETWKNKNILVADKKPGIYIYYQYFTLPDYQETFCRKGFICYLKVEEWENKVILPHENTSSTTVNNRLKLLAQTGLNAQPTHGLYADPDLKLDKWMDEAIQNPIYKTTDKQGVNNLMGVIQDPEIIAQFLDTLAPRQIIIADGHHRYTSSLEYKKQKQALNPNHTGEEGYNYHLIYLTNVYSSDEIILPTQRLIKEIAPLDEHQLIKKTREFFTLQPIERIDSLPTIIKSNVNSFGMLLNNKGYEITLKSHALEKFQKNLPPPVQNLSVAQLHYFFIEKILNIPYHEQWDSSIIIYEKDYKKSRQLLQNQNVKVVLIPNGLNVEEVMNVCQEGYTLPPKSTFFYPKVITGLVFGSINENEF